MPASSEPAAPEDGRAPARSLSGNGFVRHVRAFTLIELVVVIVLFALLASLLVPASAHTRPNSQAIQCLNNLRQMANAWQTYAEDNGSRIVSAYPNYGGFAGTWCAGNAESGGGSASYTYGGADPMGIQKGLLWNYTKSLGLYHCPTDHRSADGSGVPSQFVGKPILRSISMNSYMAGRSFGVNPTWVVTSPNGPQDPNHPVYLKDTEIKLPKQTWVLVDEDQDSINDGMFFVDVGGTYGFIDLPSRAHRFGYDICFADGHVEIDQFKDDASKDWRIGLPGGLNDWMRFTNITTHPL
jgi:prepilin-type N-terminal cleavage/methylation domain-containing protein/prepilin-type processing-associated H-X9-DG protein